MPRPSRPRRFLPLVDSLPSRLVLSDVVASGAADVVAPTPDPGSVLSPTLIGYGTDLGASDSSVLDPTVPNFSADLTPYEMGDMLVLSPDTPPPPDAYGITLATS